MPDVIDITVSDINNNEMEEEKEKNTKRRVSIEESYEPLEVYYSQLNNNIYKRIANEYLANYEESDDLHVKTPEKTPSEHSQDEDIEKVDIENITTTITFTEQYYRLVAGENNPEYNPTSSTKLVESIQTIRQNIMDFNKAFDAFAFRHMRGYKYNTKENESNTCAENKTKTANVGMHTDKEGVANDNANTIKEDTKIVNDADNSVNRDENIDRKNDDVNNNEVNTKNEDNLNEDVNTATKDESNTETRDEIDLDNSEDKKSTAFIEDTSMDETFHSASSLTETEEDNNEDEESSEDDDSEDTEDEFDSNKIIEKIEGKSSSAENEKERLENVLMVKKRVFRSLEMQLVEYEENNLEKDCTQ